MTDANSIDYYRSRETFERGLAQAAANPAIAAIHVEMAERYAALVDGKVPESSMADDRL